MTFIYGSKSQIAVGGNPVRPGAESISALFADWGLGRGLRLAKRSDRAAWAADQNPGGAPGWFGRAERKTQKGALVDAVASLFGNAQSRLEPGVGVATAVASLAHERADAGTGADGINTPICGAQR